MIKLCDLIQITRYGMGSGDKELSVKLISNYLKLIIEDNRLPSFITFYNDGVQLLSADSPIIEQLVELEEKGVKLIACKTCLDYNNIDTIVAGVKGTMMDIITLQSNADKVINL